MDDLTDYLIGEVVVDYRDAILTRREAGRRLALLGVGAAAAAALLAGCSAAEPAPAPAPSAAPQPPGATEPVRFAGPEGRALSGAWAAAAAPRGAVLVLHENKGLTDHVRSVAARLAAAGLSALALDLLSEEGGTASLGAPENATAALAKVPPERFVADMRAGLDELARRVPGKRLGAVGFCFGGAMTWRLVAAKDPRLAAAAPFYGPFPEGADLAGAKAAVLGVYASKDERVNASREAARAALERAGLVHEIVTFEGVDHAFFNDTGKRYDAAAAEKAWGRLLAWFASHLA